MYCFFDDMINIKTLNLNQIKIDETSYKDILTYHFGYLTAKDLSYAIINSVNPLYFTINKINEYIDKSN